MQAVKLGTSRQVVIPKQFYDELGLESGDYLVVERAGGKLILTPKALIDKVVEQGLKESLTDYESGRSYGPFDNAEDMIASLRANTKKRASGKSRRTG